MSLIEYNMNDKDFLPLIEANQGIIHKICRIYRDRSEDREDLFQEIVFQLWRSRESYNGGAKLSTWMYRIALNTAISVFRKKVPSLEYSDELPDIEDIRNEEQQERYDALTRAIQQLNDADKGLIALYLDDLSYQEMAEITGISAGNVGVRLNRIKSKIQTLIP